MIRIPFLTDGSMTIPGDRNRNLRLQIRERQRRLQIFRRNARTRKHLANLPPYLRRDIGLTDEQVGHEINKKFWQ